MLNKSHNSNFKHFKRLYCTVYCVNMHCFTVRSDSELKSHFRDYCPEQNFIQSTQKNSHFSAAYTCHHICKIYYMAYQSHLPLNILCQISTSHSRIYTVILFSSRYLLPAKSICPTCNQTIYISVQMRAAPPSNRKTQHICLKIYAAGFPADNCWGRRFKSRWGQ